MPTTRKRYTAAATFTTINAKDRCNVTGCIRRPHHFGAATCTRHMMRANRLGDANATGSTRADLRQYHEWLRHGLDVYRNAPAVKISLKRAHRLLNYAPTTGDSWAAWFASRMLTVRCKPGRPVTALDLLVEVLAFFHFERIHPQCAPTVLSRNVLLARAILRLGRGLCRTHARKTDLAACGAYIAETLGKFSVLFLDELTRYTRTQNRKLERESAMLSDFTIRQD